jgi:adenine-specific DNA methylase
MFSIHSYRHIVRPVELNPWLKKIGRGTFPNVLSKILKAIQEAKTPHKLSPLGGRFQVTYNHREYPQNGTRSIPSVLARSSRAAIITSSSEDLSQIPDNLVDLIFTDPPYYDNLSYSKLSDFYLSWQQALGVAEPPYDDNGRAAPFADSLAAKNKSKEAFETYRKGLFLILSECYRVLNPDGLLVFTYHHKSIGAWSALGSSLALSGFKCTGVLPLRGEGQGGLHSFNRTIKWDAVFACRKQQNSPPLSLDHDQISVLVKNLQSAKQKADQYFERFQKDEKLGFREPDRLNLERALITAAASNQKTEADSMRLTEALQRTKITRT